ncbi:DUF1642 domain-containing protein [Enterococcus faecalis]|nr:DUF1642 domain-containing protein [Enterococcus faecalis]
MNKQELIEELECLEIPADSYSYFRGANYVTERAISLAKQLDEPKKAVLPKTATDFIEESLGMGSDKVDIISSADYFSQEIPDDEFSLWFKSNRDLFVNALANGYEVEKEPTYVISVPNCGTHKHYLARFINSNFEMPVFRHIGEEDPLFFKDKAKAAVIADWVKGTVEKWEDNDE